MIANFNNEPYTVFSNFHPCIIEYEGIIFPSVEHAYQASKTKNQIIRRNLLDACVTAKIAKKYTKKKVFKKFIREDFDCVKYYIMHELVFKKFTNNVDLKKILLDTGNQIIEEGNYWHDKYWGVCHCNDCKGDGENHLGKILMKVRSEIKKLDK